MHTSVWTWPWAYSCTCIHTYTTYASSCQMTIIHVWSPACSLVHIHMYVCIMVCAFKRAAQRHKCMWKMHTHTHTHTYTHTQRMSMTQWLYMHVAVMQCQLIYIYYAQMEYFVWHTSCWKVQETPWKELHWAKICWKISSLNIYVVSSLFAHWNQCISWCRLHEHCGHNMAHLTETDWFSISTYTLS